PPPTSTPFPYTTLFRSVDEGGIWRLRGRLRPTARLVELVALRLGDLTGSERTVLELLTLGEPLGQATLDQLADPAAVEALEHKRSEEHTSELQSPDHLV